MNIYLAGPFFSHNQLIVIEKLERVLSEIKDINVFSPRKYGILGKGEKNKADIIFSGNVKGIDDCDLLVAVIDDRDTGTIWEMGYAYGIGVPILTYTEKNYDLNIMISQSVKAHCKTIDELIDSILKSISEEDFNIPYEGGLF